MKQRFNKIKLFSIVLFSSIILLIKDINILSILLLFSIITALTTKTRYRLLDRIKPLMVIGLMVVLFQVLFNTSIGLSGRFFMGVATAEKIILLSMIIFFYTLTTSLTDIVASLSFLPRKLSLMLTITLSLIPSVIEESKKIKLVQQTRGHFFGRFNICQSIFPIIIPLIHRSLKRAEQLSIVLSTRGYEA